MQDRFRLKFWDKTCKNIVYPSEDLIYKTENSRLDISGMLSSERFIPLQCTGLRDKNGKLIFEGDIVKSSTTYWNGEVYSDNGLICWDRTKWQIGVMKYERPKSRQNKRYDRALDFARFVSFQDNTPLKKFANVEVIGNVYENPELLEDGNANIQR